MNKKIITLSFTIILTVMLVFLLCGFTSYVFSPINITASSNYTDRIEVKWDAADGADSYNIYKLELGQSEYQFLINTKETIFADINVRQYKTYEYTVTSVKDGIESDMNKIGAYGNLYCPSVETCFYSNISSESFTSTIHLDSPYIWRNMVVAVWSDNNGQDDLRWYRLLSDTNNFSITVYTANHNYDTGKYIVHYYLTNSEWDTGNYASLTSYVNLPDANGKTPSSFLPKALETNEDNVEIYTLNIGHGDSTLVISQNASLLIDVGRYEEAGVIENALNEKGINKIDVVLTHSHSDHSGGLKYLIEKGRVNNIYCEDVLSETWQDNIAFKAAIRSAKENNISVMPLPETGTIWNVGDAKIEFIYTDKMHNFSSTGVSNNNSAWIKISCNGHSYLITGDAEVPEQQDVLALGIDIKSDCYKVPHHGEPNAYYEETIREINPRYVFCSQSPENGVIEEIYTLDKYRELGFDVRSTYTEGTILCQFTDDMIYIMSSENDFALDPNNSENMAYLEALLIKEEVIKKREERQKRLENNVFLTDMEMSQRDSRRKRENIDDIIFNPCTVNDINKYKIELPEETEENEEVKKKEDDFDTTPLLGKTIEFVDEKTYDIMHSFFCSNLRYFVSHKNKFR